MNSKAMKKRREMAHRPTGMNESTGKSGTKATAADGLAHHQRNPLAPPINIEANS